MPEDPSAHYQLGALEIKRGHFESAKASLLVAVELSPDFGEAHMAVAKCCLGLGDKEAAINAYNRAASARPGWLPPHVRLAKLYRTVGKIDKALHHFREVLRLDSGNLRTVLGIGSILEQLGHNDEAVSVYQEYLEHNPPNVWLLNNIANLKLRTGHLDEAITHYRKALELQPDSPHVYNNLANALYQTGLQENIEEAFECYRKCVELDPSNPISLSNMCMSMHYFDHFSLSEIQKVARQASLKHPRKDFAPADIDFSPERRIRVGYVSADLRNHSVAFFLNALWAEHDHENFEIHAYSAHPARDVMTEKLEPLVDNWHPVFHLKTEEFAGQVCDDRIDIHFAGEQHALCGPPCVPHNTPGDPVDIGFFINYISG